MDIRNILKGSILTILCVTPLILTPFIMDYFFLFKIYFIYIIIIIMSISWVFIPKSKSLSAVVNPLENKLIFFYFFLLSLSTFLSINIELSLIGGLRREEGFIALTIYIILFMFSNFFYRPPIKHIHFVILSATIVALYGILQTFNFDPIPLDMFKQGWSGIPISTIGNPNFLGSYLVLMLPLSIFMYLYNKNKLYLFSSAIIYYCLLATMTRGAWLGAFVSFLIITWFCFRTREYFDSFIKIFILFSIVTIFYGIIDQGAIIVRLFSISNDLSLVISQKQGFETAGSGRIIIWQRVIELIKERPLFGYGPDTLSLVFPSEKVNAYIHSVGRLTEDRAHNEYLQIAFASGIPALLTYLAFIFVIIKKAAKKLFSNPLILPFFASVIGYLVQAFFNISVVSVAYIFWIFLGILVNLSYKNNSLQSSI